MQFNRTNVTSLDWNTYQTLRFGDHPAVTPIVVQQLHEKSSGAGEEVLPAVVAAIGNAFFDATGVRIRQYPLTPHACAGGAQGREGCWFGLGRAAAIDPACCRSENRSVYAPAHRLRQQG